MDGNFWNSSLPSDIIVIVNGVNFNLHKFPLVTKCGRVVTLLEESGQDGSVTLEGFPGGSGTFILAAEFCYGLPLKLSPENILPLCCAADYLQISSFLSESLTYLHRNILNNWANCLSALRTTPPNTHEFPAVQRCLDALSLMVYTDPGLFGWPMYGKSQSPGGSLLWNGIRTGVHVRPPTESDWWFDHVSLLEPWLFERLICTMTRRGAPPGTLAAAVMYYCKTHIPGLGRWGRGVASGRVDPRVLIQRVVCILPETRGRSFCGFLLGLIRVASILAVDFKCREDLEMRAGRQLELATLDGILIPSYYGLDPDLLYDVVCVERMVHHFLLGPGPARLFRAGGNSEESGRFRKVAELLDSYLTEVASDYNLKPGMVRTLAEALPDDSRNSHDGLYRAVDIYMKVHPWITEEERAGLCGVVDFRKLSVDVCAHASRNKRLPLRSVLRVVFSEQMHFRAALAGRGATAAHPDDVAERIVSSHGWLTVVRANASLKSDMGKIGYRVAQLEQQLEKIKGDMAQLLKKTATRFILAGPNPCVGPPTPVHTRVTNPEPCLTQTRTRTQTGAGSSVLCCVADVTEK